MVLNRRRLRQIVATCALLAVFAVGCGGSDRDSATDATEAADTSADSGSDDSDSAAADTGDNGDATAEFSASTAAQELDQVSVTLSTGFGSLSRAQQGAVAGAADGQVVCSDIGGERADPTPSQVEVEIITAVEGCLRFSYDVAEFRSLVADLREIRSQPDVVAASPLLLDYRLIQLDDTEAGDPEGEDVPGDDRPDEAEVSFGAITSDWAYDAIDASSTVDTDASGAGITIAIIDSGIDTTASGLANATVRRAPDSGIGDYVPSGHGTIAAAAIVAPLDGGTRGLAPSTTLLDVPADLCGPTDCGCDPCAPLTAANAIRWATDNGADIISMSFGYQPAPRPVWWQLLIDDDELASATDTLEIALAYAHASDVAMAAAAGNCASGPNASCVSENQFEIPAGHVDVIGVAAVERDGQGVFVRADYSTQQRYVDLAAPGSVIRIDADGIESIKRGTSYSTPFVAAALALLIGDDGPLAGYPDRAELARQILFDTADDLSPAGRDDQFGYGQLQIAEALAAAATYVEENPPDPELEG